MQQKRSRVIWFIAIGIAFFAIVDPFRLFVDNKMPRMRVNSEIKKEMGALLGAAPTATQFVIDALDRHDVVMIGEAGFIKQQLEFLVELIPELDRAGIHHLGFQYANRSDQERIDSLLTAREFDRDLAESILFSHQVILGYEEKVAVFRAAWEVNRGRGGDQQRFRIIGIGTTPDYTAIEDPEDVDDPEVLRRVFAGGIPDAVMVEVIESEFLERGIRAAVYTKMEHAFTGFVQPLYGERMEERGYPGQLRAGNELRRRYGTRVASAIIHSPLRDTRSRIGFGFPVGGTLDDLIKELPEGARSRGFFVAETPYADAPVTSDSIKEGVSGDLLLATFADAYLILTPITSYSSLTAIPEFIDETNMAEAIRLFPGPSPGEVSVADLNEYIAGNAAQMQRIFDEFK